MVACVVCLCVKLLVYVFCVVHIFLMQRRIGFMWYAYAMWLYAPKCQSPGNQQLWQQLSFYFLYFFLNPVANMAANYVCIKKKKGNFKKNGSILGHFVHPKGKISNLVF